MRDYYSSVGFKNDKKQNSTFTEESSFQTISSVSSQVIKGKNILALEMLERALDNGIDADYLLVDSWYAKPNFIKEANTGYLGTFGKNATKKFKDSLSFISQVPF